MKTTDVYERYFEGECEYNGRPRHAAAVKLTAESDSGTIKYTVSVNFFPHDSADDFAVSYDAYFENVIFEGKGRRSKKKEEKYLIISLDLKNHFILNILLMKRTWEIELYL